MTNHLTLADKRERLFLLLATHVRKLRNNNLDRNSFVLESLLVLLFARHAIPRGRMIKIGDNFILEEKICRSIHLE